MSTVVPPRSVPGSSRSWFPRLARGPGWLVLAGLLWLGGPATGRAAEPVSKEYQLKAAYLYNFTKFVEWPEQGFNDTQSPIVIGILGRNPFGDELDKIVRDRAVNGRAIRIVLITTAEEVRMVHLLFVPAGEEGHPAFAAALAQHPGVLTVGESAPYAAGGGVITFTPVGDKLRFTINLEAAEGAGLKVSAQLLKLATVVRRQPGS